MRMRPMIRGLLVAMAALNLWAPVQAVEYNPPEAVRYGIVQALEMDVNDIIIEGHRYSVSLTAHVEIGGTYGAYTMLEPGMRVEYHYYRYDDGRRVIFWLRELAPNEVLERA